MDILKAAVWYGLPAYLAGALMFGAASPGAAGRRDAPAAGSAPSGPAVRCPPRIVAKCAKGETPVCIRRKAGCCATFRCRKPG